MANDYGYDDVDDVQRQTSSGGKYMKLEDGKQVQVRIASKPKYTIKHYDKNTRKYLPHTDDKTCEYCGTKAKDPMKKDAQWYWIVIDREDDAVKILQATNTVARRLKELSEIRSKNREGQVVTTWGDPQTFDVTIKRYKKDNGFTEYTVEPVPDTKGELNKHEKEMLEAANYDLDHEIANSRNSEHLGNYGGGHQESLENAPDGSEDVDPDSIPDNLGEDTGVKTNSDDGMPF